MKTFRRILQMKIRFGVLAALLLVAVNLFALKVTYDYDRAFDFSKVKTYQWIELKDSKVNSLTDAKLKQAINDELSKKGFTRVDSNPSLYIAYQVGLQKEEQINTMTTGGWGWGPWYGGGMGTMTATTSTINIGTLVIDMVNPADKKLVFRSQGTDTLNPSSDPDKNYKKIQKAVEKILKNFPPKAKK
jgi:Domain of unknown function (DUF4136)